ncbi:MFS transporter [Neorhizobium lilium]|uniref:MFS transporter n=1 Tax=Neorhizobium lilium TaxID=2503024 RepID=UPI001FE1E91D|nr:MFS transporter [Neorhizobium lilium]
MTDDQASSRFQTWLSIAVLGIAAFTMVTTEFAPIGLMTQMAVDLGEAPAKIGLTVTLYAWFGALSGLLAPTLVGRVPRKALLIGLMLLIAASNAIALLSPSLEALFFARFVGSVAHGIFWATVAAFAMDIAPPRQTGLATSIVFGGISIATVMGVPAVNIVGQAMGWRGAFGALSLLGLLTAFAMMVTLPNMATSVRGRKATLADALGQRSLWSIYAITALIGAVHFSAYTFAEPFIAALPGVVPAGVPVFLFAFGAAGLLGSVLGALLIDRFLHEVILCALAAMGMALIFMGTSTSVLGLVGVGACLVVWGAAISILFATLQTWVLKASGPLSTPAAAVHTAVLNAAIGIGAMTGSIMLDRWGPFTVMLGAGIGAMLPLGLALMQKGPRKQRI